MDLLLLAKVLWRKTWILLTIPLLAAGAAFFFTMDAVEKYNAYSQISTGFTQSFEVSITNENMNPRDADIKFSNLLNSMNAAIPANLVMFRLMLHDLESESPFRYPEGFHPTPEEIETVKAFMKKKLETFMPLSTSDPEFKLVSSFLNAYNYHYDFVKEGLYIWRVQNTDNVQVDFTTDDPYVSAYGANVYADEFIRYYQSLRTERTGQSVEFLKQLVEEKKMAYDEKRETQKVFKESNSLVDIHREGDSKMTQLQELERQRDDIRSRIQKLELMITRITDDMRLASSPTQTTTSNQRIIDLGNRIRSLNTRYITGGSSNQALLDSLNQMRELLRIEMEKNKTQEATNTPASQATLADLQSRLKDAEIDLKVEKSNLASTESKIGNLRYVFSGFASKEAALEAIEREVDLAQREYLEAVSKFTEAKNRLISSTTLRKVLDAAPPPYPEKSKRYLIIGGAGFASLALCVFAIVALELTDFSTRTPDRFARIVGLPLAGTINRVDTKNFNIRSYFNQSTKNEETEMYKSSLRKLRHEIENSGAKVLLFTSPRKEDGKTFVAFSLAYVLSLINKRVLIVDTNFKNNSLSKQLVKPNTEIKVLEGRKINLLITSGKETPENGEGDTEETPGNTYELINPTKYKNIFIIGNEGGGTESPAEILSGRDFRSLVSTLMESFDYVIMEGADLNENSDSKELVPYAEKVYAVFSADHSVKQLDRESIAYFKTLGKKFGGAVLNKVKSKDLKL